MAARAVSAIIAILSLCTSAHAQAVICPITPAAGTSNQLCANTAFVQKVLNNVFSPVSVSALPASPSVPFAVVNNGTLGLAWGATVTGGGSTKYLVWFNGSHWTVVGE
jgi:hypothetical protein